MQHPLSPPSPGRGTQLEDGAATEAIAKAIEICAAKRSSTVQVACGIERYAGIRLVAVHAVVVEIMQNLFGPASPNLWHEFENCAAARFASIAVGVSAAEKRRAVEVTVGVESKATGGVVSVTDAKHEAVNQRFRPTSIARRRQLEYRTFAMNSPGGKRA